MTDHIGISVREDYAALAEKRADALLASQTQVVCCSEAYDVNLMKKVPKTVVEADFGCGNPTKYIRPGDVVLDLGCGAGMNCYIAAQIAGPSGSVIGIDFNDAMLSIARKALPEFSASVEAAPLAFRMGSAHDLALDLDQANDYLRSNAPSDVVGIQKYQDLADKLRHEKTLIADNSVDVVISNCVINLLADKDKNLVFQEIFRVLKPGGRFAISDNVSNIPVPEVVKNDAMLWSACYAGVLQEQQFYSSLETTGFVGITIEVRNDDPAKIIEELEFYSITVTGEKPLKSCGVDTPKVMYKGPSKAIVGDSGKMYRRGVPDTLSVADRYLISSDGPFYILDSEAVNQAPAKSSCC
ncbi:MULTISPECIES: methyltransferase domain-containing protein [unclassified Pseudomonas]|uniref:methyltransferase domain-containing protein n=1 Tax=unclassified Pseudomonas TaxID=196821 RepID=UPI00119B6426|nr:MULTISPECIES: methyltransferase domain-containing protein [unclassified Pseudomonas]TWC11115.1 methyltransferase family protein [Pseudomonas sp. SJZ074]TWC18926.1 methyltransferase family protein [Pseudomonas sp. SJZ075]TWC29576.1 methyltransferase family protein [Pseudomonas sp. SJZ085]TWC33362.1 methyltransferase family protein [Pseudomonas sp. SJZ078]TWC55880.1 methyltransferase family protein [Pseudomonas sp. SJZ124]